MSPEDEAVKRWNEMLKPVTLPNGETLLPNGLVTGPTPMDTVIDLLRTMLVVLHRQESELTQIRERLNRGLLG